MSEWPSERPWYFVERLSEPSRPRIRSSDGPPDGAVVVDDSWSLRVEGEGAALETAVAELERWLYDLGVTITKSDPGAVTHRGGADAPVIELIAGGTRKAEGYRIEAAGSRIAIESAGPRGVLHGVYALEEHMARLGGPWILPLAIEREPFLKTRILRSVWSPYYVDELTTEENYYPDGYLETLSRDGFNGIWLHGYLQELAPFDVFPELGAASGPRLKKLRRLITRAARYGIDVYVYFCEPKALPVDSPFWTNHPELKGRTAKGNLMDAAPEIASLCTSAPEVQAYIEDVYTNLFREAPGLGGVILITASENHSHCYSHGTNIDCPRCSKRKPVDVVRELIGLVEKAVHRADPEARVISWTWSWRVVDADPQRDLIQSLPEGVDVMSDFERGTEIVRRGKAFPLDEYAMSIVGPSPRFSAQAEAARDAGRAVFAKLQISTTHELVTVPYYPVPQRWAQKWEGLKREGVSGVMGSWIFGNYPSFVMEILRELTWEPHPPLEELLAEKAEELFGPLGVSHAVKAWRHFGDAFEQYPFSTPLIYYGPMNRAPALPWSFPGAKSPMGPSWRMSLPGDSLEEWTRPYGPELALQCFEAVLEEWEKGLDSLNAAVREKVDTDGRVTTAGREYIVAHAFAAHIRSTIHFLRFSIARDAYESRPEGPTPEKRTLLEAMREAVLFEIENRKAYLPLVRADSRLGFHSEVEDYWFTAATLETSIEQLVALAARLEQELVLIGA